MRSGSVAVLRMRLAMGLTIIGAALVITGLLFMLVGEILRLKPAHGGFGMVRAGEIAAICGLASGVALLVVLTVGPADRAGRSRRGQARAAGPAQARGSAPVSGSAEQWLSPLRGPGAVPAPPRAVTLRPELALPRAVTLPPEPAPAVPGPGYAGHGWQPPAGEGWSPGPAYVWQSGGPGWDHAAREDWSPDGQDGWAQDEWYERDDWAPDEGQAGWADGGQEGWEPETQQAGGWQPGVAGGWDRAGDDWGPGAAVQDVRGWPAEDQWRPDAQPADDPHAPYLAGPEPGHLAGQEPSHLAGPQAAYLAGPLPAPGPPPAGLAPALAPLPDGPPGGQRSPGRGRRPDGEYEPGHAEPPSPDTQEKIEQIKDLYLTAEAIGEEALVKHFDQLKKRQRSLIREFFEKAGLGSMGAGGDAAGDPAGSPARDRAAAAAERAPRDGASLPR